MFTYAAVVPGRAGGYVQVGRRHMRTRLKVQGIFALFAPVLTTLRMLGLKVLELFFTFLGALL